MPILNHGLYTSCSTRNTSIYLDTINALEWPLSVILVRLVSKFLSFFFPREHTVVPAVTAAVPLLPLHVKWLLQVPWAIDGISIREEITVLKAFGPNTSRLLTLLNASPRSTIKFSR